MKGAAILSRSRFWEGGSGTQMDPEKGPLVLQLDGTLTHLQTVRGIAGGGQIGEKLWPQMTSTEQTCALYICAKKNRYIKDRLEHEK